VSRSEPDPATRLTLAQSQRAPRVDLRLLRRVTRALLGRLQIASHDLAISLVSAEEIARLNGTFLNHPGPTDVIAFDYTPRKLPKTRRGRSHAPAPVEGPLHGDIFICPEQAEAQARQFRVTWQAEIARYVVHGVLHLMGYDDHDAADRREMKRVENRLLAVLARQFDLEDLRSERRIPFRRGRRLHQARS
jgi:probable rRNA maturation factor